MLTFKIAGVCVGVWVREWKSKSESEKEKRERNWVILNFKTFKYMYVYSKVFSLSPALSLFQLFGFQVNNNCFQGVKSVYLRVHKINFHVLYNLFHLKRLVDWTNRSFALVRLVGRSGVRSSVHWLDCVDVLYLLYQMKPNNIARTPPFLCDSFHKYINILYNK